MAQDVALLVLRLTGLFMAFSHGWGKVVALAGGEGGRFVEGVASLGFPVPVVFAWAAALAEFAGGILVAAGLFTRASAAFAAFTMAVAAFGRHQAHRQALVALGLASASPETMAEWGKPELALLYGSVFLALLLAGPGRWSVDRRLRKGGGKRR